MADILHDRPLLDFQGVWYKWGWGLDITHGGTSAGSSDFAAVLGVLDPYSDTLWIMDEIVLSRSLIPMQAAAIRQHDFGDCVCLYPRDSKQSADAMTGDNFVQTFKKLGLNMAGDFTWAPLEDGVSEVASAFATGKLKIHRKCRRLLDEYSAYHRLERKVVREFDDALDALRILTVGRKQMRHFTESGKVSSGLRVLNPQHAPAWGE